MDSAYFYLKKLVLLNEKNNAPTIFDEEDNDDDEENSSGTHEPLNIAWLYIFFIFIGAGLFGYLYLINRK